MTATHGKQVDVSGVLDIYGARGIGSDASVALLALMAANAVVIACHRLYRCRIANTESRPFPPEKNFAGLVGQACLRRGLLVYPMQGCLDGVAGDDLLIAPPADDFGRGDWVGGGAGAGCGVGVRRFGSLNVEESAELRSA